MLHLTRLRLVGFKSFVETADVRIDPGLTGVVGPNGCGKSNVVEALRWVMGETSARQLRGDEMDDVIFGGSANRPARNIAEVTLTLDNAGHQAPPLFNTSDEIEITRRIRRGDGSVYRVNGKEVRARDVQLLFADLSSGARSAAMVSQNRVAALISAKPTQRRALLEEAAGIAGLHTRRHEARNRLNEAENNLLRLDDVINTLKGQMNTLSRQAKQAVKYRDLSDRLFAAESTVLRQRWLSATNTLESARRTFDTAQRDAQLAIATTTTAGQRQNDLSEALPPLRVKESEISATLQRLVIAREQLEGEERALSQSKRENTIRLEQASQDFERERERLADAVAALSRIAEETRELEQQVASPADTLKAAEAAWQESSASVATLEERFKEATRAYAAYTAQRDGLRRSLADAQNRLERLERRLGELSVDLETARAETGPARLMADLTAREEETAHALEVAQENFVRAEKALVAAREADFDISRGRSTLENARGRLIAEADGLKALLKASTRTTNDRAQAVPVIDLLSVPEGLEKPLASVFGSSLNATLDPGSPAYWVDIGPAADARDLPESVRALSADISGPPSLTRALSYVGLVVSGADPGALQRQLAPGQQIVDPEGTVWRWDGLVLQPGAQTESDATAQRLETRNRLNALDVQISGLNAQITEIAAQAEQLKADLKNAIAAESDSRGLIRKLESDRAALQSRRIEAERQLSSNALKLQSLEQNLAQATTDAAESTGEISRLSALIEELETRAPKEADRAEVQESLDLARKQQMADRAHYDQLRTIFETRNRRIDALKIEARSWEDRRQQAERHSQDIQQRMSEAQATLSSLEGRPEEFAAKKAALGAEIKALESERKTMTERVAEAENAMRAAGAVLKEAQRSETQAREAQVRGEAALDQAKETCRTVALLISEKRNCSPEQLPQQTNLPPDAELPSLTDAEATYASLARDRDALGPVNLVAEEESRTLSEQTATLSAERDDLTAAIARLRQAISELNKEGRARLLESFQKVDEHFQRLFLRLFGGGRAHLSLTEGDDPLEAGLDIMASPPGKRLQNLSLLSGGEQALTALALLFAVFLTNPAPICVLDEVDAPLDDANVDRFCTLLRELTDTTRTRFLIVTHHRMTMARMDRLYGVTMTERGVSSLVSVDLQQADALVEEPASETKSEGA